MKKILEIQNFLATRFVRLVLAGLKPMHFGTYDYLLSASAASYLKYELCQCRGASVPQTATVPPPTSVATVSAYRTRKPTPAIPSTAPAQKVSSSCPMPLNMKLTSLNMLPPNQC